MASRQNSYAIINTTEASETSHGRITDRVSGLDTAIDVVRKRGPNYAIAHCSILISSDENDLSMDAMKDFYSLVTTDMQGRPIGKELKPDDQCFQCDKIQPGLQQFIDSHPGVRLGLGSGPFYVAIMPDGGVFEVDTDGTVVETPAQ